MAEYLERAKDILFPDIEEIEIPGPLRELLLELLHRKRHRVEQALEYLAVKQVEVLTEGIRRTMQKRGEKEERVIQEIERMLRN